MSIDWLAQSREDAWELFRRGGPPARDVETWRRMSFGAFALDRLGRNDSHTGAGKATGGRGLEMLPLEEAARRYPEQASRFLRGPRANSDFRQLEAANLALSRGGLFLRVPAGTKVAEPVHLRFLHEAGMIFGFPRVVVLVEPGGELSLIEEHSGGDAGSSIAFSDLSIGDGAKLRFYYVQELGPKMSHFWHQRAELGRDAELEHWSAIVGGARHKSELDVSLSGAGARSGIRGIALGRGGQIFDCRSRQDHTAPNTVSDMEFRTAMTGRARSVFTGAIRIEREAPGSEAYQINRNLLLSEGARSESTPILEILPDQVRCTHGASSGPLSREQLFYLMSRGIAKQEALRLLVLGFLDPVLSGMPSSDIRERLGSRAGQAALEAVGE